MPGRCLKGSQLRYLAQGGGFEAIIVFLMAWESNRAFHDILNRTTDSKPKLRRSF
jgi:hypothetical protein